MNRYSLGNEIRLLRHITQNNCPENNLQSSMITVDEWYGSVFRTSGKKNY